MVTENKGVADKGRALFNDAGPLQRKVRGAGNQERLVLVDIAVEIIGPIILVTSLGPLFLKFQAGYQFMLYPACREMPLCYYLTEQVVCCVTEVIGSALVVTITVEQIGE